MWPFVVFCDLSVFLHDGLWCKVQLLWILPYFCGICDNYGIYGGTVGLQCISNFFLVIFTQFRGFSKVWMFWMEYDILVWAEADFMIVSMISVWI